MGIAGEAANYKGLPSLEEASNFEQAYIGRMGILARHEKNQYPHTDFVLFLECKKYRIH